MKLNIKDFLHTLINRLDQTPPTYTENIKEFQDLENIEKL